MALTTAGRGGGGGGAAHKQMPTLKNIIYTENKVKPEDRIKKPTCVGVNVYSFQEVVELGGGLENVYVCVCVLARAPPACLTVKERE